MADRPKTGQSTLEWGVSALPKTFRERETTKLGTSPLPKAPPSASHAKPRPPAGGSAVPPPADQKK